MHQQDFFNINPEIKPEKSLENKFSEERLEWSKKVSHMSEKMSNVMKIAELMTDIYTERQRCVEYYHYLLSILIKINKEYRKKYAERWDFWSYKSQIRYPNNTALDNKIKTELSDILEKRELLDVHSKFILATCSTLDNIIYAIPKRIEIENISRGK